MKIWNKRVNDNSGDLIFSNCIDNKDLITVIVMHITDSKYHTHHYFWNHRNIISLNNEIKSNCRALSVFLLMLQYFWSHFLAVREFEEHWKNYWNDDDFTEYRQGARTMRDNFFRCNWPLFSIITKIKSNVGHCHSVRQNKSN